MLFFHSQTSIENDLSFWKSDTSFLKKQHVIFEETTRRFWRNNTSFSKKQHVIFEEQHVIFEEQHVEKNGGVAKMSFAASPLGVSRKDKGKASSGNRKDVSKTEFQNNAVVCP